ncbi:MAG: UDP-N-acetylglucosamine acyltransferase [Moritella sp.]
MIHVTAIVHETAKIGKNVAIGPWSIIGENVEIGDDCVIASHVVIKGPCKIGQGNRFFQYGSIGEECQDLKYAGEATRLEIGDNNVFREGVTIHRGTVQDNSLTKIGSNCLFMVNAHVAHDVIIGDNCIFANNATLAGHVHIGDFVIFGGHAAIHQFGKVGAHAFIAGGSVIIKDIPPYVMASGHHAKPFGINSEGLRRRGFDADAIKAVKRAYRVIFRSGKTIAEALTELEESAKAQPSVALLTEFLKTNERGIIR